MVRSLWQRVDAPRLRSLAVAAAAVGLLAGIVAATFVPIAGEPAVDDAIAIEEANATQPEGSVAHDDDEASVSRSDQRGAGLFGAYALSGAAFGALLALTAWPAPGSARPGAGWCSRVRSWRGRSPSPPGLGTRRTRRPSATPARCRNVRASTSR